MHATSQPCLRARVRTRGLGLCVIVALTSLVILAGQVARAEPTPGPEAFWTQLGETLEPNNLARIRAIQGIDAAVELLLKSYDGDGDSLVVRATKTGLRVEVKTASRSCKVGLTNGESGTRAADDPATGAPCPLRPDDGGPRTLELDRGLWSVRKPRRPRPVSPSPSDPDPPERPPSTGTLMRIRIGSEPWQILREFIPDDLEQRHLEWRETIGRTPWRDPLLPTSALEAGAALSPLRSAEPAESDRALDNLKNPFDDSRMRTADPLPQVFRAVNQGQWNPGSITFSPPALTSSCVEEVTSTAMLERAPTLTCFQAASWHARHLFNKLPAPVTAVLNILQVPIINEIRMFANAEATKSTAYETAWVASWLDWVRDRGSRLDSALRELTDQERRLLRRFVGRWWSKRISPEFADILGLIVETRFTGLYPEALDIAGFPRRSFFDDPWLWTGNWITVALATPLTEREDKVALAIDELTAADIGDVLARLGAAPSESPAVQHLAKILHALSGR